jgi:hypothetical protein
VLGVRISTGESLVRTDIADGVCSECRLAPDIPESVSAGKGGGVCQRMLLEGCHLCGSGFDLWARQIA